MNSTTCAYLADKQLEWDVCDTVGSTGTVAACVSSIEDTSSPYASTAANCSFVQYWSNPTVFPIDCRCGDAAFEAPCKHLDTGDRRYFSGTYNDPANGLTRVGTGPDFVQVMDMKVGPYGQFYAVGAGSEISEPKIWRVDPATGNRTLIFDAATAPASALCPNGSTLPGLKTVQMAAQRWSMESQGRFYFSMVNQPGPSIVRISADGTACD